MNRHAPAGAETATTPLPNPDLQITHDAGSVTISWDAAADGQLESSPDLSPGSWQPVTETPTLIDGRQTVVIHTSTARRFYRLVQ